MNRLKLLSVIFLALLVASPRISHSQTTVNSDPVGFVTTTIPARAQTFLISPVMHSAPTNVTGLLTGTISGVTSNTVTVTSAGWVGNLATNRAYLHLTSGTQDGLVVRIITNTATTLTLDTMGINLVSAGVASNNTFKFLEGATLLSMFGRGNPTPSANIPLGGTASQFSARTIDTVVILDTTRTLRTVYFDTTANQWRRSGSGSDMGTVPIPPSAGLIYNRVANQSLALTQIGSVPTKPVKYIVPGNGTVFLSRFFPQDGTLSSFGAISALSGWKNTSQAGVTATTADKVVARDSSGTLRQFFFNGTNWVRSGSGTVQNGIAVPAGSAVYTIQSGTFSPQILTVPLPYTL